MRDQEGNKIQCPDCRSTDVHYSNMNSMGSFFMGILFNMDALRCYSCQNLFYKRTAAADETEPGEQPDPPHSRGHRSPDD